MDALVKSRRVVKYSTTTSCWEIRTNTSSGVRPATSPVGSGPMSNGIDQIFSLTVTGVATTGPGNERAVVRDAESEVRGSDPMAVPGSEEPQPTHKRRKMNAPKVLTRVRRSSQ